MTTFKITLAYDGSGFVGWQRQTSGTSIQGLIEDALAELAGGAVRVTGAGRTDAGVHATGQVASFALDRDLDPCTILRAVNARLPAAVRVLAAERADPRFHARFDARSKSYRYRIFNRPVLDPFERAYVWHVAGPLDVAKMERAARLVEGRHDFAAFQGSGGTTHSTERELFSSSVSVDGALVTYEVSGEGFLRHMVRNIVGSLVEVGHGRQDEAWIREVLVSRDRTRAGPTAPGEGLFLVRVDYDEPPPATPTLRPCG
jgi:tRNA pseudouridine38-40 synthase